MTENYEKFKKFQNITFNEFYKISKNKKKSYFYYSAHGLKGKVDNLLNLPLSWEETMKRKYSVGIITGFTSPFVEMGKAFELNSASVAGFAKFDLQICPL